MPTKIRAAETTSRNRNGKRRCNADKDHISKPTLVIGNDDEKDNHAGCTTAVRTDTQVYELCVINACMNHNESITLPQRPQSTVLAAFYRDMCRRHAGDATQSRPSRFPPPTGAHAQTNECVSLCEECSQRDACMQADRSLSLCARCVDATHKETKTTKRHSRTGKYRKTRNTMTAAKSWGTRSRKRPKSTPSSEQHAQHSLHSMLRHGEELTVMDWLTHIPHMVLGNDAALPHRCQLIHPCISRMHARVVFVTDTAMHSYFARTVPVIDAACETNCTRHDVEREDDLPQNCAHDLVHHAQCNRRSAHSRLCTCTSVPCICACSVHFRCCCLGVCTHVGADVSVFAQPYYLLINHSANPLFVNTHRVPAQRSVILHECDVVSFLECALDPHAGVLSSVSPCLSDSQECVRRPCGAGNVPTPPAHECRTTRISKTVDAHESDTGENGTHNLSPHRCIRRVADEDTRDAATTRDVLLVQEARAGCNRHHVHANKRARCAGVVSAPVSSDAASVCSSAAADDDDEDVCRSSPSWMSQECHSAVHPGSGMACNAMAGSACERLAALLQSKPLVISGRAVGYLQLFHLSPRAHRLAQLFRLLLLPSPRNLSSPCTSSAPSQTCGRDCSCMHDHWCTFWSSLVQRFTSLELSRLPTTRDSEVATKHDVLTGLSNTLRTNDDGYDWDDEKEEDLVYCAAPSALLSSFSSFSPLRGRMCVNTATLRGLCRQHRNDGDDEERGLRLARVAGATESATSAPNDGRRGRSGSHTESCSRRTPSPASDAETVRTSAARHDRHAMREPTAVPAPRTKITESAASPISPGLPLLYIQPALLPVFVFRACRERSPSRVTWEKTRRETTRQEATYTYYYYDNEEDVNCTGSSHATSTTQSAPREYRPQLQSQQVCEYAKTAYEKEKSTAGSLLSHTAANKSAPALSSLAQVGDKEYRLWVNEVWIDETVDAMHSARHRQRTRRRRRR